ncbi:hypothetical protein ACIBBG_32725 [Micromonospora chersina]|uniref:hypothetical protein n=1 Tax=Micromonospora chersina TaxID=47854 RepID=UPI0037908881
MTARREWVRLPRSTRLEAARLAAEGRPHPDRTVRAAAVAWGRMAAWLYPTRSLGPLLIGFAVFVVPLALRDSGAGFIPGAVIVVAAIGGPLYLLHREVYDVMLRPANEQAALVEEGRLRRVS